MAHQVSLWWNRAAGGRQISSMLITYVSPEAYGTEPRQSSGRSTGQGTHAVSVGARQGHNHRALRIFRCLGWQRRTVGADRGGSRFDVGGLLRLSDVDRRMLAQSGLAGFAVVTGAPVAGVLFSMEALRMGRPPTPGLCLQWSPPSARFWLLGGQGHWHPLHATFSLPNLTQWPSSSLLPWRSSLASWPG